MRALLSADRSPPTPWPSDAPPIEAAPPTLLANAGDTASRALRAPLFRVLCPCLLFAALLLLDLRVLGRDLEAPIATLVAGSLHLQKGRVRIGRARLHPLGELLLSDVEIGTGRQGADDRESIRIDQALISFDPVEGFHGRVRLRGAVASQIRVESGPLGGSEVEQATLLVLGEGRSRVLLRGAQVPLLASLLPASWLPPLSIEHLSVELLHGSPQRLAASGVSLGSSSPAQLLLTRGPGGVSFRLAISGGEARGSAGAGEAEAAMEMSRLRLPAVLGPTLDLSNTRASGNFQVSAELPPQQVPQASSPSPPEMADMDVPLRLLLGRAEGTLLLQGQVMLDDVGVHHPLLTPLPLPNLTVVLDGDLSLSRRPGEEGLSLSTSGLGLSLGDARFSLAGEVGLRFGKDKGYRADLELVLDEIECSRLLSSLPRRLLPKLEGLGVGGRIGGLLRLSLDSRTLPELDLYTDLSVGCQVISDPPNADVRTLLDPHLSIERPGEDGRPHRLPLGQEAPGAEGVPGFQPISALPWPVVRTFLVAEDNLYYQHHGFDLLMIARALGTDLLEQRTSRGASTITQQLVKNMWLGQERALGRKLEEAVLSWRLEQVVPKERALEVYLNLMELGSGIYGLSMASQHYFGLVPAKLSVDQAAQLAALLPAPRRGMDAAWSRRYHDILHRTSTAPVPHFVRAPPGRSVPSRSGPTPR